MTLQPHELIWGLSTATVASRTLQVIAELGVADHLDDGPVGAGQLAEACGADAGALERALLLLAAHGVFEHGEGGFRHTEASRLLRQDHPSSMRAFPRMMGLPSFTASLGRLDHSLRTGGPAFELVDPGGLFAHLATQPDEAAVFDASMTSKSNAEIAAVLGVYDFSGFAAIADIGGGRGHLLRAALDAAPTADGVLFDLPGVVDTLDVTDERLRVSAGDFFVDELPKADAYLLMEVLHDWDDTEASAILAAVRRAAASGATVLVIEAIADDDRLDPVVRTLDVLMLAVTGGRERTAGELERLLEAAGFRATRVIETPTVTRILEAVAV